MSRARAILAIVAVSIAWHLKGLSAPPYDYHYHRQTNTAAIARHYAQGRPFLSPQIDWDGAYSGPAATEFPLYMWLTGKLWPLAGLGDVWGRLLSAACSALAAVYLFLFLDRRFSRAEAVWSAILFGVIPIEVYFGRTIQPEALALAATLAAFYHWDCFLDDDSPLHWCAAVLAAFLAIAHKLPYAYLLPALATLTLMRRGAAAFKRPLVLAAPIICAAGVWSWYHHASAGAYVVPDHLPELLAMLGGYAHFPYYVEFQLFSRLPELGATWPGMAMALAGAWLLWRRGQRFFHAWWGWVFLSLAAGGAYSFDHEYTALPLAPIMAAFMGPGLVWAWRRAGALARARRARAGVAALLLSMPAFGYYRIKRWYIQNFQFLKRGAPAAQALSRPSDLFLCNQRASSVYLYAMDRRGWSFSLAEAGPRALGDVRDCIARGARFFATAAVDFRPADRAWFDARFPKVYDDGSFLIYRLGPTEPSSGRP